MLKEYAKDFAAVAVTMISLYVFMCLLFVW